MKMAIIVNVILGIFLPVVSLFCCTLASYLRWPGELSLDRFVIITAASMVWGCLPFSIIVGVLSSLYSCINRDNLDKVMALLLVCYLIIILWSWYVHNYTMF